jgi:MFS family permease
VKSKRVVFFVLGWMGMVLYFTQRWLFGPVIPSLMQDFSINRTMIGVIGSASLWGYMLTPVVSGMLSDRFGRKYPLLCGIFAFSTFTVVSGLATSANQLILARFLTGIGEAFFSISIMAFTLELFPERPGFYLTFMTSGNSLGWFAGPALAGWLVDLTGNWRWPFVVAGAAGLVVTVLLLKFWPEDKKRSPVSRPFFDRAVLKPSNLLMLLLLALTCSLQIATEFGFTMWYPVFLKTELGMTATMAGLIAGIFGIGQFFGRPVMGLISDKFGYRNVGAASSLLHGISFILILSAGSTLLKALFTFQAGFLGAAVIGSLLTYSGLAFPTYKGLALGIIVTFAYSTASLAPVAMGYISDHYSVAASLWSICLPSAFLAGLPFLATRFVKSSK